MNPLTQLFLNIPDRDLPARHAVEYINFSQHELFFHLAITKHAKLTQLREHYKRHRPCRVMLGPRLAGFECGLDGYDISVLERDFFTLTGSAQDEDKKHRLADSIVIVNNNDIASPDARSAYSQFTQECITACFIAWDWDNHHWLDLSTFLAAYSDLYAPSHHENLYLLSRYNWLLMGPVYCATEQWPRKFLTDNLDRMLQAERLNVPLGMHIPHLRFNFRMQVVSTLNRVYPSVGFSNPDFHHRTRDERFNEWCAYKTHWIAPVLNDVPIRLFDALITGGIPIVPEAMRYLPPIAQIPKHFIVFYSAADIVNPEPLVAHANELFDRSGRNGLVERHRYALDNHHSDVAIAHILKVVHEQLST